MMRSADRAARGVKVLYFQRVRLAKSSGYVSKARSWMVTTPGQGRRREGKADRVRLLRRDERGGPAAARAAGLEVVAADLIALADADDAWLPGKLGAQLDALAAHPDAAMCFGRAEVVDERGKPTGERWRELAPGIHDAVSLRRPLFESNPIPAASVV